MITRFSLSLLLAALAITGCERVTQADKDEALLAVRQNVEFLQSENLDAMMKTIHSQSPAFAQTREMMTELTDKFDLRCELNDLAVVSASSSEIRVRFSQITSKVRGEGEMPKTKIVGVHVLKKDDGHWKIFGTQVLGSEVLGSSAEPAAETPEASADAAK